MDDSSTNPISPQVDTTVIDPPPDSDVSAGVTSTSPLERTRVAVPISTSRRMCDLARFVEEIRNVERHTMDCNHGGSLVHGKTIVQGMASVLVYKCSQVLCPAEVCVQTARPEDIHLEAVEGNTAVGIGHSQALELFASMKSPFMSYTTYARYEKRFSKVLDAAKERDYTANIELEKRLAIEAGDVDDKGNALITGELDGTWGKRTYGHGFNSNSGAALIIGRRTKKILFSAVCNKYCHVCTLADKQGVSPLDHECHENYNGPSSGMEAAILIDGLKTLKKKGVWCTRIIGDGDSSLMKEVTAAKIFGETSVRKIRCANHAVRNFRKALEKVGNNSQAFRKEDGIAARQLLQSKTASMAAVARGTIARHAARVDGDVNKAAITSLQRDLLNIPYHVLGLHDNCPLDLECKGRQGKIEIRVLKRVPGFMEEVDGCAFRLASLSISLIYNYTSNLAENAMSQIAKTTGGKRINYAAGRGYGNRVTAATLAFNHPAQAWHACLRPDEPSAVSNSPMSRLVSKRILKLSRNKSTRPNERDQTTRQRTKRPRSKNQPADLNYGAVDVDELDLHKDRFYENRVQVTAERRIEIEEATRNQASGNYVQVDRWMAERTKRITASNAKKVFKRRSTTLCTNLVRELLYPVSFDSVPTKHGIFYEPIAKEKYGKTKGFVVEDCGIFVDFENPFLCASPDGIVHHPDGDYLIEVKCPFKARNETSMKAACRTFAKEDFPLRMDEKGKFYLPEDHQFYYQIQVQLQCSDLERCDYVVYLSNLPTVPKKKPTQQQHPGFNTVLTIMRNREFMRSVLPVLKSFYFECMLSELADPRVPRGQPIREPLRIMEARRIADEKRKRKADSKDKKTTKRARVK